MHASLLQAAKDAMEQAYAPYSRHRVGAAILAENGKVYSGCNVENAAYPIGNCAETSAIAAMVRDGARRIREIAVIGSGTELCTPCGGCRQHIREFAGVDTRIHACDAAGVQRTFTCDELLPASFGPEHLP